MIFIATDCSHFNTAKLISNFTYCFFIVCAGNHILSVFSGFFLVSCNITYAVLHEDKAEEQTHSHLGPFRSLRHPEGPRITVLLIVNILGN